MLGSVIVVFAFACTSGEAPEPPPEAPDPLTEVAPEPPPVADPDPLPAPTEAQYAATHILVAWRGAARAPAGVTRSRDEAHALASDLHDRVAAGESLAALARTHSDGPSAPRGGQIGTYLTGTMVPEFEAAVASVEPGELAPLVSTPFGWHVARRDAVVQARVSHLLVSHADAHQSVNPRSRDDARILAEAAHQRIEAGEAFEHVVSELSDDKPTAERGGDLGWIAPGQMVPAFESAALALDKGSTSAVIETDYGFHIIRRTE